MRSQANKIRTVRKLTNTPGQVVRVLARSSGIDAYEYKLFAYSLFGPDRTFHESKPAAHRPTTFSTRQKSQRFGAAPASYSNTLAGRGLALTHGFFRGCGRVNSRYTPPHPSLLSVHPESPRCPPSPFCLM